jgi:drug/metabolite transporter (DMT)-like permease
MRKWPPVLWLCVFIGSLLILNGSHGKADTGELIAGIALALVAFGLSLYLALGPWPGAAEPPRPGRWLVAGVLLFYLVAAIAALVFVGVGFAVATLLAALIPGTAAAAWVATVRSKTPRPGQRRDPAAAADDPFPGIGMDDSRPLGDTPEAHDELTPHDLPPGHPARRA